MARKSRRSASAAAATKTKGPPKSKYAKVSGAEVFGSVNYLNRAGRYIVLMNSIEEGTNHNNILFIQANMTILKVLEGGEASYDYDKRNKGELVALKKHSVAEEVVDKIMSNGVVFASNVKRLAMAVGDLTQEDFDGEEFEGQIIEEMVSEDQPLAGTVMEIRAIQVVKKDSRDKDEEDLTGKDVYTRVDYVERLEGEDIEDELDDAIIERFSIDTSDEEEGDADAKDDVPS